MGARQGGGAADLHHLEQSPVPAAIALAPQCQDRVADGALREARLVVGVAFRDDHRGRLQQRQLGPE